MEYNVKIVIFDIDILEELYFRLCQTQMRSVSTMVVYDMDNVIDAGSIPAQSTCQMAVQMVDSEQLCGFQN